MTNSQGKSANCYGPRTSVYADNWEHFKGTVKFHENNRGDTAMAVVAELYFAPEAYIELDVWEESNWCRVTAVHQNRRQHLGAEVLMVVAARLLNAVEIENAATDSPHSLLPGLRYTWALSLAEEHSSLHTSESDGCRILLWIDHKGNPALVLHLTKERVASWRSQLVNILLPWRSERLELVRTIVNFRPGDDEDRLQQAIRKLESSPAHKGAADVLFNPTRYGLGSAPTLEELVDAVRRYLPREKY